MEGMPKKASGAKSRIELVLVRGFKKCHGK